MHELGLLMEIVKTVEKFAVENKVGRIEKLVLQIGEISSVIPEYMKKVYPAAVEGSMLEDAALEIEILPANGRCLDCGRRISCHCLRGSLSGLRKQEYENNQRTGFFH